MESEQLGSKQLYEAILNGAAQALVALDEAGRIVFANDAVTELTGFHRNDLMGKAQHAALGHADRGGTIFPKESCPICLAFLKGVHRHSEAYSFQNQSGSHFPVEFKLTPYASPLSPVRAVVTFSDVTQRRKIQQQLVQLQNLQSIGQLASGIAHELNTPIQYINDNLHFLQSAFADLCKLIQQNKELLCTFGDSEMNALYDHALETLDVEFLVEEVPAAIGQSIEGSDRVSAIVRAMKEFVHPAETSMVPVDLNRVVEHSLTVARHEWKYVADVESQLDMALPMVQCQGNEMHQVILNLIVNAAHAVSNTIGDGQEKGKITITTRNAIDHAEIRITDTGGGIPEEIRDRIFDPFFTTKGIGKGTGQGLALAHAAVVQTHRGTIDFESELGVGTTFIVRLPMTTNDANVSLSREDENEACPIC